MVISSVDGQPIGLPGTRTRLVADPYYMLQTPYPPLLNVARSAPNDSNFARQGERATPPQRCAQPRDMRPCESCYSRDFQTGFARVPDRIFLLSPASCAGRRCAVLMRPEAEFDLARRVHGAGAPIGEVFSFLSALYFRGKLAYAEAFARPPADCPGILVITPGRGLLSPSVPIGISDIRAFCSVSVDLADNRYREPLVATAHGLRERLTASTEVVLLGSVATKKYVGALLDVFGSALLFPGAFIGRGDMSRGGLMLRSAEAERELEYLPVLGTKMHGKRPPKLPRRTRSAPAPK